MIEFETQHFDVTFAEEVSTFDVEFSSQGETFDVSFGAGIEKEYHGQAEVMPSSEEQVLHTTNRVLTQDIIIDPIPSNYGLVTYNGSTITVS